MTQLEDNKIIVTIKPLVKPHLNLMLGFRSPSCSTKCIKCATISKLRKIWWTRQIENYVTAFLLILPNITLLNSDVTISI